MQSVWQAARVQGYARFGTDSTCPHVGYLGLEYEGALVPVELPLACLAFGDLERQAVGYHDASAKPGLRFTSRRPDSWSQTKLASTCSRVSWQASNVLAGEACTWSTFHCYRWSGEICCRLCPKGSGVTPRSPRLLHPRPPRLQGSGRSRALVKTGMDHPYITSIPCPLRVLALAGRIDYVPLVQLTIAPSRSRWKGTILQS